MHVSAVVDILSLAAVYICCTLGGIIQSFEHFDVQYEGINGLETWVVILCVSNDQYELTILQYT